MTEKNDTYRQWLLKSRPDGMFSTSDFELREVPMPQLSDNELLIKTLCLSFDPAQRTWAAFDTYMPVIPIGEPMRALGFGQIVESTSPKFRVGDPVAGFINWQEYAQVDLQQKQLTELTPIPAFLDPG